MVGSLVTSFHPSCVPAAPPFQHSAGWWILTSPGLCWGCSFQLKCSSLTMHPWCSSLCVQANILQSHAGEFTASNCDRDLLTNRKQLYVEHIRGKCLKFTGSVVMFCTLEKKIHVLVKTAKCWIKFISASFHAVLFHFDALKEKKKKRCYFKLHIFLFIKLHINKLHNLNKVSSSLFCGLLGLVLALETCLKLHF